MDWPVKFIQVFLLYRPSTFAHVASRISAQVSRCPVAASTMDWLVRSFQVLRSLMDPLVGATQPVSQDDRSTPLFIYAAAARTYNTAIPICWSASFDYDLQKMDLMQNSAKKNAGKG